MGVVKNLMVRIGADVRGVVNGMKSARSATAQASDGIKKSTKETKRSIIDSFTSPVKAVKEYTTDVAKTKAAHQAATQNVEVLTDKITRLEETYGTIKNATDGLDLSKSLVQQIGSTEKSLEAINSKIHKTQAAINAIGTPRTASKAARLEALQTELQELMADSDAAAAHLSTLNQAAARIGPSNLGAASAAGLQNMQQEIIGLKNQLETTKKVADETGNRLQSLGLGATAARAAGAGIKNLAKGLKDLAVGATKGIAKLVQLRESTSSCGIGIGKMLSSIRNIGIASLGMRIAGGMFGRLRSIISSYIYTNESLNASVTSLKNQMGQALAPAINLVLVAMQRLMPVITAVSNAINSVFAAIFGKAEVTSAAITATTEAAGAAADSLDTYGFDQITKVTDSSGGGSSSGTSAGDQTTEQSSLVQKLTGWIQELKAAFVEGDWEGLGKIVGDGINNAVNAINTMDLGAKAGTFANNLFTSIHSALTTTNFFEIGNSIGKALTAAIGEIDWYKVGEILLIGWQIVESVTIGAIQATDWALVGKSLTEGISGFLQSATEWIRGIDWLQLGQCARTLVANVDWSVLATDLCTAIGAALGGLGEFLWGLIGGAWDSMMEQWLKYTEMCGGDAVAGLLTGIVVGLANIGSWIWNNVFVPIWNGITGAFEIHSPSKKMAEVGGNIVAGLLNGILAGLANIATWIYQHIVAPFLGAFTSIKTGAVNAFVGLWTGVKGVINLIIGGVESMVNWVVKGINGLIDAFNKVASVGTYFGLNLQISKISTVNLPRLAKGAVVDEPTAAIVGEAGKEAVMPLENNTGWITELAQKINQQGGDHVTSLALAIYFRSRKLAEYVIQDINQITREKGVCPITI